MKGVTTTPSPLLRNFLKVVVTKVLHFFTLGCMGSQLPNLHQVRL